jgi:short-subunit dehydrogenase involved in D-alanine esterification of teichoic acids
MAAGSALALAGENDVPVAVTGRHDSGIRAFSLSLGHDASRLALQSIDLGPPFAEAELVSTTI